MDRLQEWNERGSLARRTLVLLAKPLVRGWAGGLFALLGSAVVFPLVFIQGTHINHGTMPYFVGGLIATAVIFAGSALTARLLTPDLAFSVEKIMLGEYTEGVVFQPTVEAQNNEVASVVVHNWKGRLEMGGQSHSLRRAVGQAKLAEGLDLPFLDRIGPLPPGPTVAHLQFVADGMPKAQVEAAMSARSPVVLSVEVMAGKHRWQTTTDLSSLPIERRR